MKKKKVNLFLLSAEPILGNCKEIKEIHQYINKNSLSNQFKEKLEKKYAPALDNYGQSCFVRSNFLKMKCVCKTQMMPLPDHQNPVDMHTSIISINIIQNIKAVALKHIKDVALKL
jgi:hypothetical protein